MRVFPARDVVDVVVQEVKSLEANGKPIFAENFAFLFGDNNDSLNLAATGDDIIGGIEGPIDIRGLWGAPENNVLMLPAVDV